MDKRSTLGICMSIADKWLREKERPSVSFLRGMMSLLVLLAYLGINVFSNTRACRGGYGDPFRMDSSQYHQALNWEGRWKEKKPCSSAHLASSGGNLQVLKSLVGYSALSVTFLVLQRSSSIAGFSFCFCSGFSWQRSLSKLFPNLAGQIWTRSGEWLLFPSALHALVLLCSRMKDLNFKLKFIVGFHLKEAVSPFNIWGEVDSREFVPSFHTSDFHAFIIGGLASTGFWCVLMSTAQLIAVFYVLVCPEGSAEVQRSWLLDKCNVDQCLQSPDG